MTFQEWMNRPLQRVHVATWRIAVALEGDNQQRKASTIRFVPQYRNATVGQWRNEVAGFVKMLRNNRRNQWQPRLPLPVWNESTSQYTTH